MAKLIHLSRHRWRRRKPAEALAGDLDLAPIAIVLWIGSVARIAPGVVDGEFRAEATLALFCVFVIPCWLAWSWIDHMKRARETDRGHTAREQADDQLIDLAFHRRFVNTPSGSPSE